MEHDELMNRLAAQDIDKTVLAIKINNSATNEPCAICGKRTEPTTGPELFKADSFELVCHNCGRLIAPELVAMLEWFRLNFPQYDLQAQLLKTEQANHDETYKEALRTTLLEKYKTRDPHYFRQYDSWCNVKDKIDFSYALPTGLQSQNNVTTSDNDYDVVVCTDTFDLMNGSDVRVFIRPDIDKVDAVRLLEKTAARIKEIPCSKVITAFNENLIYSGAFDDNKNEKEG